MIPSTTKLALLSGIVLIVGGIAYSSPVKYDRRQEGPQNFAGNIEDVLVILIPSKSTIDTAVNLLSVNSRDAENLSKKYFDKMPTRTASKLGFASAEKSPYKVDLERSTVPLGKVDAPAVVEVIEIKNAKPQLPEVEKSGAEAKTVKKELKMEEKKEEKQELAKNGKIFFLN